MRSDKVPKLSLRCKDDFADISFDLYHSVNIIMADESATGKTNMVQNIIRMAGSEDDVLSIVSPIFNKKYTVHQYAVNMPKSGYENELPFFIIDDYEPFIYYDFIDIVSKTYKEAVFLVIARDIKKCSFSCFLDAVYKISFIEGEVDTFRLNRVIDSLKGVKLGDVCLKGSVSECIIEGAKHGNEARFYANIFPIVHCSGGRHNIKKIVRLTTCDTLIVIVDSCAFGANLDGLLSEVNYCKSRNVYLVDEILSFEYMLVSYAIRNGFYNPLSGIDNTYYDYIDGFTFEDFYKNLLSKIKIGLCGYTSKSNIVKCFVSECEGHCNIKLEEKRKKCKFYGTTLYSRLCDILSSVGAEDLLDISKGCCE